MPLKYSNTQPPSRRWLSVERPFTAGFRTVAVGAAALASCLMTDRKGG